jgi:hypothetical protein
MSVMKWLIGKTGAAADREVDRSDCLGAGV